MPSVKLNVPYKSQWDPDAKDHSADCGPTSLAMLLAALGDNISPDQLYRHIGARGVSEYTSFTDLTTAAKARGLPMTRKNFLPGHALAELQNTINNGTPFVALIKYALVDHIAKNNFKGAHFVIVTGYDEDEIFIHDPLFKGQRRELGMFCRYTFDTFLSAWGGFRSGENPNYAALISGKPVSFLESSSGAPTEPVPQIELDESMRRRLRAKAAYDGQPDPDLNNPNVAANLVAQLGDWGASWESHTVRRGDSISKIAAMYYNDRNKWPVIVYFNNITDPAKMSPGDTFLIPLPELTAASDGKVPLPGFGGPTG